MPTPEARPGPTETSSTTPDAGEAQPLAIETRRMVPSLRVLGPRLLVAGVLPLIGYGLLRPHVNSDATALAAVMIFPVLDIALERRRHGRLEPIGMIALIGIIVGIIGAGALDGDATLLKLRESALTGIFGLVCLGSLFARRPMMFLLGRSFATGGDPAKVAEFDQIWDAPGARRRFRRVTAVWGAGLIAETVLRTILALTISTGRFLAVAPAIGWVVIGGLLWYSNAATKAGEREALLDIKPPSQ